MTAVVGNQRIVTLTTGSTNGTPGKVRAVVVYR